MINVVTWAWKTPTGKNPYFFKICKMPNNINVRYSIYYSCTTLGSETHPLETHPCQLQWLFMQILEYIIHSYQINTKLYSFFSFLFLIQFYSFLFPTVWLSQKPYFFTIPCKNSASIFQRKFVITIKQLIKIFIKF